MRRVLLTFALVAGLLTLPAIGALAAGDSPAEQAAKEIAAAQSQANAAAQKWEEAKVALEGLADEEAQVQLEQAALQAQVDELSASVEQIAVNRFVSGSTTGIPLLNGLGGPTDQVQAEVLAAIVNDTSASQLNDWEIASDELDDKNAELQAAQERTKQAQDQLAAAQAQAEQQVVHLQEVEAQRLKDEAVRRELERIRAAERAQEAAEAAAAQQAAAQAAAVAAPSAIPQAAGPARGGGTEESAAPAATSTEPAATAAPASGNDASATSATSGTSGGGSGSDDNGDNGGDAPTPAAPQVPTPAPTTEAPEAPEVDYDDNSITCPAPGAAFGDTWGAARSGGRRHEGVDMIGTRGTPLYAVVSGSVQFKQTSLGGNSAWVNGNNGNRYFYAHLDRFEGSSRSVSQGELIGYMGATGNANGTNHLHFEIHPGGGSAVNPYPAVRAVC